LKIPASKHQHEEQEPVKEENNKKNIAKKYKDQKRNER